MRHKDIIYVSNADSVEVVKFLIYLRTITSTVSGVADDALVTRDADSGAPQLNGRCYSAPCWTSMRARAHLIQHAAAN